MKSRRVQLVAILLAAGGAVWFLGGGPRTTTVAYDLGHRAADATRFTVRFHRGDHVVRTTTWNFQAGTAPRQLEQEVTHPRAPMTVLLTVESAAGIVSEERPFDGTADSDRVVLHLAP